MTPQDINKSESETTGGPPTEITTVTMSSSTSSSSSYWDAPPEKQLEGKTLSTIDMSMLAKEELKDAGDFKGNRKQPSQQQPRQESEVGGGYWDWKGSIRKSLSKMALTDLFFQHTVEKTATANLPENILKPSTKQDDEGNSESASASSGSVASPTTTNTTTISNTAGETAANPSPYWFWRNASFHDLPTANTTSLGRHAAKATDDKQKGHGVANDAYHTSAQKNGSIDGGSDGGGFWFWRNPSHRNLATDSNVSLDTLEKMAKETDRMQGHASSSSSSSNGPSAGPISNLQHKLRSSWRTSFQRLSTNSLSRLDEAKHNDHAGLDSCHVVGEGGTRSGEEICTDTGNFGKSWMTETSQQGVFVTGASERSMPDSFSIREGPYDDDDDEGQASGQIMF